MFQLLQKRVEMLLVGFTDWCKNTWFFNVSQKNDNTDNEWQKCW